MFRNINTSKLNPKLQRKIKWRAWLNLLLKHKGIVAHVKETTFCGYNKQQHITKIFKMGNATFIQSNICEGCKVGKNIIKAVQKDPKINLITIKPICYLLNFPILLNENTEIKLNSLQVIEPPTTPIA